MTLLLLQLLLGDKKRAHRLHVAEVSQISQTKVDAPHIVLILIDFICVVIIEFDRLILENVLNPREIYSWQIFERLRVRVLLDDNTEVVRHHGSRINFPLCDLLQLTEGQHRAPEGKCYAYIETDYQESNQIFGHFDLF